MQADKNIITFMAIYGFDFISPYQILSAFNNKFVPKAFIVLYVTIFQGIVISRVLTRPRPQTSWCQQYG